MGLLRNLKILLSGNLDERGEYDPPLRTSLRKGLRENLKIMSEDNIDERSEDPWISEAENPAPREREPEFVKVESPKPAPVKAVPVSVDPWGSAAKPRGALNPLKLLVTAYMLMNLAAGALLLSNNLTITVASVLIFLPNAVFLFMLRGKL